MGSYFNDVWKSNILGQDRSLPFFPLDRVHLFGHGLGI